MYKFVLSSCTIFRAIAKFDYFLCLLEVEGVGTREGQRSYNTIVEYACQLAQCPLLHQSNNESVPFWSWVSVKSRRPLQSLFTKPPADFERHFAHWDPVARSMSTRGLPAIT